MPDVCPLGYQEIDQADRATILAALRYYQEHYEEAMPYFRDEHEFFTDTYPLSEDDIDGLIENKIQSTMCYKE